MRIVAAFLSLAVLSAADWPQWRGPNRDGIATGAAPQAWPEKLTERWKITVGEGHASPILAAGKLFVFAREGGNEVVRAIDPASGKVLWQQSYPAPYSVSWAASSHGAGPKSTPVYDGGKLCTLGINGILSCFDAASGRVLWRQDFKARFKETSPGFGAAMSPIVDAGVLFAHIGGDGNGALVAFDINTSKPKWSWNADGPAYSSPVIATIGGTRQLVTQSQRNVIGLDAGTGQLLWKIPYVTGHEQNSVTPLFHGETLILSGLDNGVIAVKLIKGANGWRTERAWENQPASMYMSSGVLSGDVLFGFGHKNKGQFMAVDPRNGQTLWSSAPRQGENAAIVRQGDTLFLLKNDAELIVARANPKAFEPLKRYTVANSPTWAHPLVLDNGVVIKDKTTVALWTWK